MLTSCQKDGNNDGVLSEEEIAVENIDIASVNKEAFRYYDNMTEFLKMTTSQIDGKQANFLKSGTSEDTTLNPILEEFINLDIVDDDGNSISFFDLSLAEREAFLEEWTLANASDMSPKLEDQEENNDLEEYVKLQNDAFDEAMQEFEDQADSLGIIKSASINSTPEIVYNKISSRIKNKLKQKSIEYAETYLQQYPEISSTNKGGGTDGHPDFVATADVLRQLRANANRGDLLINLPTSVWISAYLFYFNPLAITNYVGIGKYPPGHVAIILDSYNNIQNRDVSISSQVGEDNGVMRERIDRHWDCKAFVCYVKTRRWVWHKRWWKSGYRIFYPNANRVIAYAESQIGKPYCSGWDFITAKSRTTCFICTTITWRSLDREGFNVHRVYARWMPTIAPADVYLSSHVVKKHRIK